MIDRHHACFDRRADRGRGLGGFREGVGGQTKRQPVGFLRRIIELENGEISAKGPNGSSFIARAAFGTSVTTVGSKK